MSFVRMNGVYVSSELGRGCHMGLDGEASDRKIGQSGRGPVACSTPITHKVLIQQTPVTYKHHVTYRKATQLKKKKETRQKIYYTLHEEGECFG